MVPSYPVAELASLDIHTRLRLSEISSDMLVHLLRATDKTLQFASVPIVQFEINERGHPSLVQSRNHDPSQLAHSLLFCPGRRQLPVKEQSQIRWARQGERQRK